MPQASTAPMKDSIHVISMPAAMIRAAAKNHKDVAVIVDPADYDIVLAEMADNDNHLSDNTRYRLAVKTFEHTAQYDGAIANYLGAINAEGGKDEAGIWLEVLTLIVPGKSSW